MSSLLHLVAVFTITLAQRATLASGVFAPAALGSAGASPIRSLGTTDLAWLDVRTVTLAPGEEIHAAEREHQDYEELVIVTSGELRAGVAARTHSLGPGSVAVVLPGDQHRFRNSGGEPVTCYVFAYRSKAPADSARGRRAGGSFAVDWDSVAVLTTPVGFRRNIFDRPTTMFSRFEMHVSTLNQGLTNHAAHTHRAEEFVLMLKGAARLLIGERRHAAAPGDLVFLASQIPHSLDNTGQGPAEYFAFQGQ